MEEPMTPEYLERRDAVCAKCAQAKRPTRGYLRLLKSQDRPYICAACRAAIEPPPMSLGKLGAI
jgi:hypothetical protein